MAGLYFEEALVESGWAAGVRIETAAGRITGVATGTRASSGDERHAIGLPGMPNLHSHAFQRAMAGLAETRGPAQDTFWTWRQMMYRLALAMSPDDVQAVTALAYVEMLEAGFTRVGEFHYLHHDRNGRPFRDLAEMGGRVIAAAGETGIGLTLLPVFYAHGAFGGQLPAPSQRRFICAPDVFGHLIEASRRQALAHPGTIIGVAPHSLRAVTPGELVAILPLAGNGPIHIHVAEQLHEVDDCVAWSGRRPVEWLLEHAGADSRWCFVHATHMTPEETRRMAAAGVVAGLCPVTEANLGDGVFNGPHFLSCGGRLGIGSDSNVLVGAADELRQLEYAQRLHGRQRNVMSRGDGASTGRTLYDEAVRGGAAALGAPAAVLAPGAPADIISLDTTHPSLLERRGDRVLDAWIFAARPSPVDCVWVGGRKWVEAGRHRARDPIVARYRRSIARLLASDL
jgi:formiminoglutamate deiminase